MYKKNSDGSTSVVPNSVHDGTGADLGWESISVTKSQLTYTNEYGKSMTVSYSSSTGRVSQLQPATGSIIRKSVCVDKSRCGK